VKPKLTPKPKSKPTTPSAADTKAKLPITFRTNVILPSPEGQPPFSVDPSSRFLARGKPSPWRSVDEVPQSLRSFIGEPPAMPELSDLEEEEIRDSFGPISESVAEELSRRQAEAIDDARVRNAMSLE